MIIFDLNKYMEKSRCDSRIRTISICRCLDESEESAPAPPRPAAPSVPDCPICGKRFKSQKSRSAHLKRCSSDMGVAPAVLLQAVQRQAEESQSVSTAGPGWVKSVPVQESSTVWNFWL